MNQCGPNISGIDSRRRAHIKTSSNCGSEKVGTVKSAPEDLLPEAEAQAGFSIGRPFEMPNQEERRLYERSDFKLTAT